MFINPVINCDEKYTKEIISSPKQVNGYTTASSKCDKLLVVSHEDFKDPSIDNYFSSWQDKILKEKKPETLIKKIIRGDEWYKLNLFECDCDFSKEDVEILKDLSKKLINNGTKKIISEITKMLSQYSDIGFEEISNEYEKLVTSRLENV